MLLYSLIATLLLVGSSYAAPVQLVVLDDQSGEEFATERQMEQVPDSNPSQLQLEDEYPTLFSEPDQWAEKPEDYGSEDVPREDQPQPQDNVEVPDSGSKIVSTDSEVQSQDDPPSAVDIQERQMELVSEEPDTSKVHLRELELRAGDDSSDQEEAIISSTDASDTPTTLPDLLPVDGSHEAFSLEKLMILRKEMEEAEAKMYNSDDQMAEERRYYGGEDSTDDQQQPQDPAESFYTRKVTEIPNIGSETVWKESEVQPQDNAPLQWDIPERPTELVPAEPCTSYVHLRRLELAADGISTNQEVSTTTNTTPSSEPTTTTDSIPLSDLTSPSHPIGFINPPEILSRHLADFSAIFPTKHQLEIKVPSFDHAEAYSPMAHYPPIYSSIPIVQAIPYTSIEVIPQVVWQPTIQMQQVIPLPHFGSIPSLPVQSPFTQIPVVNPINPQIPLQLPQFEPHYQPPSYPIPNRFQLEESVTSTRLAMTLMKNKEFRNVFAKVLSHQLPRAAIFGSNLLPDFINAALLKTFRTDEDFKSLLSKAYAEVTEEDDNGYGLIRGFAKSLIENEKEELERTSQRDRFDKLIVPTRRELEAMTGE